MSSARRGERLRFFRFLGFELAQILRTTSTAIAQRVRRRAGESIGFERIALVARLLQRAATLPMISSRASLAPVVRGSCRRLVSGLSVIVATCALSATALAQADAAAAAEGNPNGRGRRGQNNAEGGNRGARGNFDPAEMQARQMANLREQFGVTDDAEWTLISDRIAKVTELRRSTLGGFGGGGRGGLGGGGRGGRGGATANPELDALRSAVNDKLPDAEIKSRLERLREARKANEAKLEKAQEDLRAVLSVRQEAFAVMMGLLP